MFDSQWSRVLRIASAQFSSNGWILTQFALQNPRNVSDSESKKNMCLELSGSFTVVSLKSEGFVLGCGGQDSMRELVRD